MSLQFNGQILNLQNLQLHILYLYYQKMHDQTDSTMPSHELKIGKTKAIDQLMERILKDLSARCDKGLFFIIIKGLSNAVQGSNCRNVS